ncbi:hypothetical protein SELMODRAFT_441475 [Selaginella moellendorffii]|uniref:Uncharacterized protein n=1 Tax=Selaginella moellendorffii TaxID=88036 RepID=D8RJT9_SELML|nr:uncharacterized protein LOC9642132 [Selaginella moellendorffii]EFJ27777.1 hypothetical protein SELMODRAFT_441475 [Selaginella moellendorffii]|eukprot:XP_002971179.1 uncharacterized protein LOC9642132 [Selaginella moellendorffii]
MKNMVKELRQELVENNRAVRAEQALRQLESEMDEVTAEVDILRKGVEARDEAIQLMREEVDRNIDVLSHAAGNRELVRELEEHIDELKAELRKKDTKLAAMGKGLDVGSSVPSSSSSFLKSGLYEDPSSSSYTFQPSSSSTPSQPFTSEGRKRVNRNSSGYKRSPRHS